MIVCRKCGRFFFFNEQTLAVRSIKRSHGSHKARHAHKATKVCPFAWPPNFFLWHSFSGQLDVLDSLCLILEFKNWFKYCQWPRLFWIFCLCFSWITQLRYTLKNPKKRENGWSFCGKTDNQLIKFEKWTEIHSSWTGTNYSLISLMGLIQLNHMSCRHIWILRRSATASLIALS